MVDVFVSYSSEDHERVNAIVDTITSAGFTVWWDRRIGVGRNFEREIERALDSASCVVVVWSVSSVESDWVRNEAQDGLDRDVLVPVMIDDVRQPLAFRRVQAVRFDGAFSADKQKSFLAAINTHVRSKSDQGADDTGPQTATSKQRPRSAIAVMPFDDLSPGGDQGWLADGMAEELIESLSRIAGLRVATRNSTKILKDQRAEFTEVGDRLEVGSIITGSIRRFGDRINVVAYWIQADDESHLWSARYDRVLEDLFALQKEIAVGIAEAIRSELGIHDTARFIEGHRYQTSDVRAWEQFQRGFNLVFTFRPSKIIEGRDYLQRALEYDPNYVAAEAWLAWSDFDNPEARVEASLRTLKKEPANSIALHALIDSSCMQWDFETAESLWRYAVEANPGDNALMLQGHNLFSSLGYLDEALSASRRGVRIDPLWANHHYFLGITHLNLGQYEAAITSIEAAIPLWRETGGMYPSFYRRSLAFAYHQVARDHEALEALLLASPVVGDQIRQGWDAGGWQGMNAAMATALATSDPGEWTRQAIDRERLIMFACAGESGHVYPALEQLMEDTASTGLGDREAYRARQFLTQALNARAEFEPYRQESRFQALVTQLKDRMADAAGKSGYLEKLGLA